MVIMTYVVLQSIRHMALILIVYLLIGSVSALTNFVKWISPIFFVLFLPFMLVHAFIYGNAKKKQEAVSIIKGLAVASIISFLLVSFFKGWIISAFFSLIVLGIIGFLLRLTKKSHYF